MAFFKNLFTEETLNLIKDLINLKKNKKMMIFWFALLPISFFFLILNLIVYLFYLLKYNFIFFKNLFFLYIFNNKYKNSILIKKPYFFKNILFFSLKNMFIDNMECRAFFNFYNILQNIFKKKNVKNKMEYFYLFLSILKIYLNRLFFVIIFGTPYLVLYCNTKLVKKLFLINKIFPFKKHTIIDSFYNIIININKDLTPQSKILVYDLKIHFSEKGIIFNPDDKLIKIIAELAIKNKLIKNIEIFKENSLIFFSKNIKSIENGKIIYTKPHLKTILPIDKSNNIYVNETSLKHLFGKFENMYYGGCSFKNGICYITKPIYSANEYKSLYKDSINYKILNIDYDKLHYNQILTIICNLNYTFLKNIWIEKENKLVFTLEHSEESLMNLIKNNKSFISDEMYNAVLSVNDFFNEVEKINDSLDKTQKIHLMNTSTHYNIIYNNESVFDVLKYKI